MSRVPVKYQNSSESGAAPDTRGASGYVEDTIVALATAPGTGAIAVLRLSGREAVPLAERILCTRGGGRPVRLTPSHRARRMELRHPESTDALDEVLVLPMLAPASFTGEDVVEIHCHGGHLVPDLALRAALAAGARLARPGEFTERAFLNGRLDLCQAEAIADLVQASSEAGLTLARNQAAGLLSQEILSIREILLDARALTEAHLDFPDEDLPADTLAELSEAIARADGRLAELAASYARGRLARRGARVVLVGRPNAGKSSLMNALLGRERAIVSAEAGTTRDYLEEPLAIGALRVLLIDTAGLRATETALEREGVERSRRLLEVADLAVVLLDRSEPLEAEDHRVLALTAGRPRILVRSKADLPARWQEAELALGESAVEVSASSRSGLDALTERIAAALPLAGADGASEPIALTRARHHTAVSAARRALESARGSLARGGTSLDLVSCDLQTACNELDGLVGKSTSEDVLDRIFRRFCVGK